MANGGGDHDGGADFRAFVRSRQGELEGQVLAYLRSLRAHLHRQSRRSITYDPQNPDALSLNAAKTETLSHSTGDSAGSTAAPAVNLKYLVEGEEEGGSPHLAKLLEEQGDRVQADLVLLSDTLLWREDHPAACVSLRGMLSASLEVFGPECDVHSGAVSGNSATVGRMGNAGGGPAELLARTLDAPVLFFGTGLVEDHWHDSDESANLAVLVNGAVTLACFWDELARME